MRILVRQPRAAFSLMELLVVIAIIVMLLALTAAGTFQVLDGQKATNTELAMQTVYKTLQAHCNAVMKQADDDYQSGQGVANARQAADAVAGGDAERAKVIMRKIYLKLEFPVAFDEVRDKNN